MKIPALIIGLLLLVAFLLYQNVPVHPTGVTAKQAVENVKKLPEVQDYLKRVPSGRVEVDNELEGEYNIRVYEIKDGHTATFNWYRVSIKSGEIRPEF